MPLEIVRNDITNMQELLNSVKSYIDERYIEEKPKDEYDLDASCASSAERELLIYALSRRPLRESRKLQKLTESASIDEEACMESCELPPDDFPFAAAIKLDDSLEFLLENLDAGFAETLLTLIDLSGKKDSEVYKKANVDRKLFSKIRNNPEYKPSKPTALAFAFALELDLYETKEFIGRAGYALSRSSKFDIIVEYFLLHRNYNIFELNNVLYEFDQPLIGA